MFCTISIKVCFSILYLMIASFNSSDKNTMVLHANSYISQLAFNDVNLDFGTTNSVTSGPRVNHCAMAEAASE